MNKKCPHLVWTLSTTSWGTNWSKMPPRGCPQGAKLFDENRSPKLLRCRHEVWTLFVHTRCGQIHTKCGQKVSTLSVDTFCPHFVWPSQPGGLLKMANLAKNIQKCQNVHTRCRQVHTKCGQKVSTPSVDIFCPHFVRTKSVLTS